MLNPLDKNVKYAYNETMEKYNLQPAFNSPLASTIFRLEAMRGRALAGDTPPWLFYDLKATLHLLESLSSARIEGNHTTLLEAISLATRTDDAPTSDQDAGDLSDQIPNRPSGQTPNHPYFNEDAAEIINIRHAIAYLESHLNAGDKITPRLIRELHTLTVKGLKRDGSATPGAFRKSNVRIAHSRCVVSSPQSIPGDIRELVDYINAPHAPQTDLIRIAGAHHRFVQIHPFDNGNGRTARLLTYAMLITYGFLKRQQTLLNPSSIFCMDRQRYYKMLAAADTGSRTALEAWCNYVASGILDEFSKTLRLLDRDFAVQNLIIPAIKASYDDEHLSEKEYQILLIAAERDMIQAADVLLLFGATDSDRVKCSRFLASMVAKGLLFKPPKSPKKYVLRFFNRRLLPYVMTEMSANGLIDAR